MRCVFLFIILHFSWFFRFIQLQRYLKWWWDWEDKSRGGVGWGRAVKEWGRLSPRRFCLYNFIHQYLTENKCIYKINCEQNKKLHAADSRLLSCNNWNDAVKCFVKVNFMSLYCCILTQLELNDLLSICQFNVLYL